MCKRALALFAVLACLAPVGVASAAVQGTTLLLSRSDGLGPLPAAGDNAAQTTQRALSGDGRFVVFQSGADDLGARDGFQHVWLRDTQTDTTTLIDRSPGGQPANGNSVGVSISRDGSAACFSSTANNLVAGVGPATTTGFITRGHVYVVRFASGSLSVADRASGAEGAIGDGGADDCLIDSDGSRVAFDSDSKNLVAGDTNANADVFVRDLTAATTTRVSVTGPGAGAQAAGGGGLESLSGDGTRIAWGTRASLLAGDTNTSAFDIYVRDTSAGTTYLGSLGTGSVAGDGDSFGASLSDDGNQLAFVSESQNLAIGDGNFAADVFVRFIGADETVLVSRASTSGGAISNGRSTEAVISGDGLGVAFTSTATNLAPDTPGPAGKALYLRRLSGATTEAVNRLSGASGELDERPPGTPSLGATPSFVAWGGDQLAFGLPPSEGFDSAFGRGDFDEVFQRELTGAQKTELVSQPSGNAARNSGVNDAEIRAGAISADGRFVAFTSDADGLVPGVSSRATQAYVRDNTLNTTTLVSRAAGDGPAAAFAVLPGAVISADGSRVAFVTFAPNLVQGVSGANVYVRTLATGELRIASRGDGPEGGPLTGSTIDLIDPSPAISRDGSRVAFATRTKLVTADADNAQDVYVRDLNAGSTTLVSVDTNVDARAPAISAGGTRVAFTTASASVVPGGPTDGGDHVYVRDLAAGSTVVADVKDGAATFGVLSSDPSLSADGTRVVFKTLIPLTDDAAPQGGVYLRDLAAGRTFLASRADGAAGAAAKVPFEPGGALSADGRVVTFTGFELPGAPDDQHAQVFRRDMQAGTTTLVSTGAGGSPANSATFGAPDADGGCVAFAATGRGLAAPDHDTVDFGQAYLRAVTGDCPLVLRPPQIQEEKPVAGRDTTAPVLSGVGLSSRRFAIGTSTTALSAVRRGTSIRFTVSEASKVRIAIARRAAGRRSGRRCVPPSRRTRGKARCTRIVAVVTLTRSVPGGRRSVPFSGRFPRKRKLAVGAYQATLRATDPAGNVSRPRTARFSVVKR